MKVAVSDCLSALKMLFPLHSNWETIQQGMDHLVFVSDQQIVRFPRNTAIERQEGLVREYEALHIIRGKVAAQVPNMHWHANLPDGLVAVSYAYVAGEPLTLDYVTSLANPDRGKVTRQLGHFLRQLHTLDLKPFIDLGYELVDPNGFAAYALELIHRLQDTILCRFPTHVCEAIQAITDYYVLSVRRNGFPLVVTHGDLQAEHILWNTNAKRLGVIDFGDIRLNDPTYDFSYLCFYGSAFLAEVEQSYGLPIAGDFRMRVRFNALRFLLVNLEERYAGGQDIERTWFFQKLTAMFS